MTRGQAIADQLVRYTPGDYVTIQNPDGGCRIIQPLSPRTDTLDTFAAHIRESIAKAIDEELTDHTNRAYLAERLADAILRYRFTQYSLNHETNQIAWDEYNQAVTAYKDFIDANGIQISPIDPATPRPKATPNTPAQIQHVVVGSVVDPSPEPPATRQDQGPYPEYERSLPIPKRGPDGRTPIPEEDLQRPSPTNTETTKLNQTITCGCGETAKYVDTIPSVKPEHVTVRYICPRSHFTSEEVRGD